MNFSVWTKDGAGSAREHIGSYHSHITRTTHEWKVLYEEGYTTDWLAWKWATQLRLLELLCRGLLLYMYNLVEGFGRGVVRNKEQRMRNIGRKGERLYAANERTKSWCEARGW